MVIVLVTPSKRRQTGDAKFPQALWFSGTASQCLISLLKGAALEAWSGDDAAIVANNKAPARITEASIAIPLPYPKIMAAPTYPNVPIAAGVPAVQRDASNSSSAGQTRLTRDSDAVSRISAGQWGIFSQGGGDVLSPDNIFSIGYAAEYRISDYQLEEGKFESYNKVEMPSKNRVVMTKGGKLSDRQSFLAKLKSIRGDLKLYNVVTPEQVYLNVNIETVNIDRDSSKGASMLTVEIGLREVRQTAKVAYTSTQTAAGSDTANTGSVQTQTSSDPVGDIQ